jgi:hypothetical protein
MRRIPAAVEILIFGALFGLGLYLLDNGSLNKAANESAILTAAAVCLSLSLITVIATVRSVLWHRHMRKHATPHHRRVKSH